MAEKIVRGRKVITERPYMPGYIFVPFDVDDYGWRKINSTRGIGQLFYSAPERPAPIRADVMQVLLDKCNGEYVVDEIIDMALQQVVWVGARVRINDGPFAGFAGLVKWTNRDRIKVLLSFLGSPREIALSSKHVGVLS